MSEWANLIALLRQEGQAHDDHRYPNGPLMRDAASTIVRLEEQVAALLADKARLDWLELHLMMSGDWESGGVCLAEYHPPDKAYVQQPPTTKYFFVLNNDSDYDFRSAIDAAREQT